jgi:hypothetical protein
MTSSIRKPWARALEVLAVTGAYYAAGKLGLIIPFTSANVSPVWPAAGLALGSILIFGWRACLGIAIGAFLVNLSNPAPLWAVLCIALGNTHWGRRSVLHSSKEEALPASSDCLMSLTCFFAAHWA